MSVRLSSYFLPITVMNNWFVYILYKFPRLTILIECRKFEVKSPNFAGGGLYVQISENHFSDQFYKNKVNTDMILFKWKQNENLRIKWQWKNTLLNFFIIFLLNIAVWISCINSLYFIWKYLYDLRLSAFLTYRWIIKTLPKLIKFKISNKSNWESRNLVKYKEDFHHSCVMWSTISYPINLPYVCLCRQPVRTNV